MVKSNFDILTGRTNQHLEAIGNFLIDPVAKKAFLSMQKRAADEIGTDLQIVSSFREHARQLAIWNAKAQGKRKILNDEGKPLDYSKLDTEELIKAILRFSALPGASRHHWGTDIDVFDANRKKLDQVELTANESDTDFKELHAWLDQNIREFEFFRPYARDLGGVSVERWHLSFAPLSQQYLDKYTLEIFEKNLDQSELELKQVLRDKSEWLYENYVLNINSP